MINGFRLVMTKGPEPGQTFILDQDIISIGRDPGNDIVINHPQVSRQHARMKLQDATMVLEDLSSTNGTFVNGMRLSASQALTNGDVIGLGDAVRFTFYGQATGSEETVVAQPTAPSAVPSPPPTEQVPRDSVMPPATTPDEEKSGLMNSPMIWLWIGLALIVMCILAAGALVMLDAVGMLPAEFYELFRPLLDLLGY